MEIQEEQNHEQAKAEAMNAELLASVSHELRRPYLLPSKDIQLPFCVGSTSFRARSDMNSCSPFVTPVIV